MIQKSTSLTCVDAGIADLEQITDGIGVHLGQEVLDNGLGVVIDKRLALLGKDRQGDLAAHHVQELLDLRLVKMSKKSRW